MSPNLGEFGKHVLFVVVLFGGGVIKTKNTHWLFYISGFLVVFSLRFAIHCFSIFQILC